MVNVVRRDIQQSENWSRGRSIDVDSKINVVVRRIILVRSLALSVSLLASS